jgi:hypothetical protein
VDELSWRHKRNASTGRAGGFNELRKNTASCRRLPILNLALQQLHFFNEEFNHDGTTSTTSTTSTTEQNKEEFPMNAE